MKQTLVFHLRLRRRCVVAALALAGFAAACLVPVGAAAAVGMGPHRATAAPTAARHEFPWLTRNSGLSKTVLARLERSPDRMRLAAVRSMNSGRIARAAKFASDKSGLRHGGQPTSPVVPVGSGPQATALDAATRTLYEANGNDGTVSVINVAKCNRIIASGCAQTPPTVQVGSGPVSLAVDQNTDTIYVANSGDNTVSVINGATCNAQNTSGCAQTPPAVNVGSVPVAVDVNQATDTVYVADWGNGTGTTVSVIDGITCNGHNTSGCGQVPASVTIGAGPDGVIVDQSTDTVYAATVAPDLSEAVYVVNGATCNATVTSGCGQSPPSVQTGNGSNEQDVGFAIDQAARTLYVANWSDNSLSMIDKATCNAADSSGCSQTPATVNVGSGPNAIALNPATHTIYTANITDWTVSAVDAASCNAVTTTGCSSQPAGSLRTGRAPQNITVDPATSTIYTPNGDDNTVSVLNGATCNAAFTIGCTRFPPTAPVGSNPADAVVNDATHTVYVTNFVDGTVSLINSARCNANVLSGCGQTVATVTVGSGPAELALNKTTNTIYVANELSNTVSVIDGNTCNAAITAGCSASPPTIAVPGYPGLPAVNAATDTVYVATFTGTVAVINGATCNATVTTGCGQTPATVTVGGAFGDIAVDQATNTIYAPNYVTNTVSVIDGNTCNATTSSGCGQTPPAVTAGVGASSVAVDQHTKTVYVANTGSYPFYGPGGGTTVSMIDAAACNATVTSGCGQTPPTFTSGNGPYAVRVNPVTDTVYVVNVGDYAVVAVGARTCNATNTTGCQVSPAVPVGGFPSNVGISQATGTVYVANSADNNVSVFGPDFTQK